MFSFSVLVLPGPFWARDIRFSFRKDLFPICFLAPSEVKSSTVAVEERVVLCFSDGMMKALFGVIARASRKLGKLSLTMVIYLFQYLSIQFLFDC